MREIFRALLEQRTDGEQVRDENRAVRQRRDPDMQVVGIKRIRGRNPGPGPGARARSGVGVALRFGVDEKVTHLVLPLDTGLPDDGHEPIRSIRGLDVATIYLRATEATVVDPERRIAEAVAQPEIGARNLLDLPVGTDER
jgi:hypothetical protein